MATMVTLQCDNCGSDFERRQTDVNNSRRRGMTASFCSRSCSVGHSNRVRENKPGWAEKFRGSDRDSLSPFRVYIRNCKQRSREMDVDAEYLKDLWDRQAGKCPYTGLKMVLPESTTNSNLDTPWHASLDRVDSERGYVRGNVEFVCQFVNLGKRNFQKDVVVRFFESLS